MNANDIILVVVSGLGVIHGLFLAVFLFGYKKGNSLSNNLLATLLIVLSFRVGKSVFLEFTENFDVKMVFVGLSTIMAIGPLYYLFVQSAIDKTFKISFKHFLHFTPVIPAFIFGLWITESHTESLPIAAFAVLFLSYYLHLLCYLILAYRQVISAGKNELNKDIFSFLSLLFYGLLAIWFVYVLNLFDETVPYVIGPILYSVIAYVISYVVFKKNYIQKIGQKKYKTNPVSEEQSKQLFDQAIKSIVVEQQFKNSELTLKSLSKNLHVSPQVMSLVINQNSQQNFNGFVNSYRIEEAINLFQLTSYQNYTIAAIAYEVGFNSISSFNTAFKKQTGKTPMAVRKRFSK